MSLIKWIDHRLPVFSFINHALRDYPTPRNLSYMWNFGSLAGIILMIMIFSGIFLAMHYVPHVDMAFDSVEHIMREVNYGWLMRYIHMNGASFFFIVVYIHIFRGLYYGSYKAPRELLWMIGVVILLLMMATAFMGYVLPWGQMSFWGATVITNLFSAFPGGDKIVTWLWGGFSVDNPTLNRFFSLHYLFPFLILAASMLHLIALHQFGSSNPLGIERKTPEDSIPFHPYYTIKDAFGLGVLLLIYMGFVFFAPNFFGEPDNYIPANPLVTPPHIVPEWYFLPFYAILRSIPDKLSGVLAMFGSIGVLFILPWLDRHPVRSSKFRPYHKYLFWVFVLNCLVLGWVGANPPEGHFLLIGRISTAYYFFHFLILLPVLSRLEPVPPLPMSISRPVLMTILASFLTLSTAFAETGPTPPPKQQCWSFTKMTGTFNKATLQRGYQVYKEVCSSCHGMKHLYYRNLGALGFSADEIKALAANYEVDDLNDEGSPIKRKALPSDRFMHPYANEKQARAANNGSLPPDLSLIIKARHNGPDYVYALLTGYKPAPAGLTLGTGMHYNPYFSGGQIAMAPPLSPGQVTYADGTEASVKQMTQDVVTFLAWAAEPELEQRRKLGFTVMIYLLVMTVVFYLAKRKIWAKIK